MRAHGVTRSNLGSNQHELSFVLSQIPDQRMVLSRGPCITTVLNVDLKTLRSCSSYSAVVKPN